MTDETRARRSFETHDAFERRETGEFVATTTPFDATVRTADEDSDGETDGDAAVTVRLPTLDAVVAGETVAEVVEDGWYETLERRLDDVHTVARAEDAVPPEIEREGAEVVLTVSFSTTPTPEDALAVVEYAEGTWVQGIVPGYDYREPAAGLIDRARQNYDDGEEGTRERR
ncbi:hypothetical protein DMJ13_02010 [halophilic archaeon]|nr:hypothetical protein DMJ13_02010 [halophilic archaeon]